MSSAIQKREARCKRRIERRLRRRNWQAQAEPMLRGCNIHYEGSDRVRGLGAGGIGAMHLLAQRTGLTTEIDASLRVLKVHQPYHESDHVLNIAYNILCGGCSCGVSKHCGCRCVVRWRAPGRGRAETDGHGRSQRRKGKSAQSSAKPVTVNEPQADVWLRH